MPIDNTALTQEEIDFLANATLSRRIAKRGDVVALDRIQSGVYQYALSRSKNFGAPVQGGFKFMVKGNRGQKLQWWQGADILTFENKTSLSDLRYDVGKAHLGWELLYDTIERNGIRINYGKGIRQGASEASVVERVVSIIDETMDDVEYNWNSEMRKHFMKSNADQPRCFTGREGLISPTTNSTGTIGSRPRSNRLFRHQLITGVTVDTIANQFFEMIRLANRRAGNTKVDYISCGDYAYSILVSLFSGTSTVAGKFDYRAAREYAMKKGEKFNIGMPQNAFSYEDVLIVNDPVYAELDEENPAASPTWAKRIDFWNFSHFGIIPVMDGVDVAHAMPYNQRLERGSKHGEYVVWCDLPSTQGVITL